MNWREKIRYGIDQIYAGKSFDPKLPQEILSKPFVNFCIHTESIFDPTDFAGLLRFAKRVHRETGRRIFTAVMTPRCPLIGCRMQEISFSEETFIERLQQLSEFVEVGFHGHYFSKEQNMKDWSLQGHIPFYNPEQFRHELAWLNEQGFHPKLYVGGWWFLNHDLLKDLEREGFQVDCSVRWDRQSTFGDHFFDRKQIPQMGERFAIGPNKQITEIQSLYTPLSHFRRHEQKFHEILSRAYIHKPAVVFSFHDYDFSHYEKVINDNFTALLRYASHLEWQNVSQMQFENQS